MKNPRKLYTPRVIAIGNIRIADAGPCFAQRYSVTCVACRGTSGFDTEAKPATGRAVRVPRGGALMRYIGLALLALLLTACAEEDFGARVERECDTLVNMMERRGLSKARHRHAVHFRACVQARLTKGH